MIDDRFLFKGLSYTGDWIEGVYLFEYNLGEIEHFIKTISSAIVKVKPNTICPSTGIRNQNHELIFENDVFIHEDYGPSYIMFNKVFMRWNVVRIDGDIVAVLHSSSMKKLKIIGNMLDNTRTIVF